MADTHNQGESLLQVNDLVKIYGYGTDIETEVLHGLNFDIRPQEFASIIGFSGSGKSTLLNILGALDTPTKGDILFKDQSFASMTPTEMATFRNRHLGFIFQFHHLLPEFTAIENVLIPTWIQAGKVTKEKENRGKELLDLVGMKAYMKKKVTQLSGGQQQRVAIARSLINDPEILLGDEPTGNLDTETTQQVYELFRKINKELGSSLIIVTHNEHLAKQSDRLIELRDGSIIRDEIKGDVKGDDREEGHPTTSPTKEEVTTN